MLGTNVRPANLEIAHNAVHAIFEENASVVTNVQWFISSMNSAFAEKLDCMLDQNTLLEWILRHFRCEISQALLVLDVLHCYDKVFRVSATHYFIPDWDNPFDEPFETDVLAKWKMPLSEQILLGCSYYSEIPLGTTKFISLCVALLAEDLLEMNLSAHHAQIRYQGNRRPSHVITRQGNAASFCITASKIASISSFKVKILVCSSISCKISSRVQPDSTRHGSTQHSITEANTRMRFAAKD
jgi:hypothetical protein